MACAARLALPLTALEWARLDACVAEDVARRLTEMARGRRFLVRAPAANGARDARWRADGFAMAPDD